MKGLAAVLMKFGGGAGLNVSPFYFKGLDMAKRKISGKRLFGKGNHNPNTKIERNALVET